MNDTVKLPVRPEVADFVERVRARLADLTDEEREELVGGLEADLSERIADGGGPVDLGDAGAYAEELRTAAGFGTGERRQRRRRVPRPHLPRRSTRPVTEVVAARLDDARARWERLMATGPWLVNAWSMTQVLRPAWWVLRAWVALQLVDIWNGPYEWPTLLPRLGDAWSGLVLLAMAVIGSVLLGMRQLWPASATPRSVLARIVLLGLNLFAVVSLMAVGDSFSSAGTVNQAVYMGGHFTEAPTGLENDGRLVRNVYAYDAEGNALQGVQLFDQSGRPLAVDPDRVRRVRYRDGVPMTYAWQNGDQFLWNVFPLPVRTDNGGWGRKDSAWESENPPFLPEPPLVAVPPALLPLPSDEASGPPADQSGDRQRDRDRNRDQDQDQDQGR
ncbi:MAG: hypothetical protein H0V42_06275 [Nocardioidaceae bacterium]|nr:hypothetical protein [Nocardioidaceae bacterium]